MDAILIVAVELTLKLPEKLFKYKNHIWTVEERK
jgi:hypothetical protein